MKIQCDVCEKGEASVYCTADEASLCDLCDHRVHHANKLASKHKRFLLLHPSAKEFPVCDVCRERRAMLFCQQDRAILCRECDHPIHSANELTQKHDRFLLTGIKLSATTDLYSSPPLNAKLTVKSGSHVVVPDPKSKASFKNGPVSAIAVSCTPSVRKNAPTTPPTVVSLTTTDKGGGNTMANHGVGSTSSISEYLMETLPGWHFEEFLDSSSNSTPVGFSKCDGNGMELPFQDSDLDNNLGMETFSSESLELWVPQGPHTPLEFTSQFMNGSMMKETKESVNTKANRVWADDGFTVPQIIPNSTGFKRSRPFW